jgi:hypothetical protein
MTTHAHVDLAAVVPISKMVGEDRNETLLLEGMLARAESYLKSFRWFEPVEERFFGFGIGNVIALFLFKFARPINGTDVWLWVVEGDVPSAYFVVDNAPKPSAALAVYCRLTEEWADAVEAKRPLTGVFPVGAPPTREHAEMLRQRIKFIRQQIIPMCEPT